MSIRHERVASLLKEEIGSILQKELSNPAMGFTTVTDVRVTPDLRTAKVYLSIYGSEEVRQETMAILERDKPQLRSLLAKRVRIRFMPVLELIRDDTLDRVERINTILKKINDERDGAKSGEDSST
ncbi:MAG: 30S ribosome-binding factor RbfA [Bacteroidota bacterium]